MTIHRLKDLQTPIGDVLKAVGPDGVLLESNGNPEFALMPLDDDLIDFLIERNPKLIEECRQIRQRMDAGQSRSHDEVKKLFRSSSSPGIEKS
jgi:hypothetical protein